MTRGTTTTTSQREFLLIAADDEGIYGATERKWVWRLCRLSPLVFVAAVPLVHRFLLHVLYLQPLHPEWQFAEAYRSRQALLPALLPAALPWLWLAGLTATPLLTRLRIPAAALLTVIIVLTAGAVLNTSRATWFFVEWATVRTSNPSFARNTLFWEQRNFEATEGNGSSGRVGLVGSSQTYQGLDLAMLHQASPGMVFEKNTMAGFGPLQYPFLLPRIREREFDVIVCQLSEFDFYREDVLPVNRLRWAASVPGVSAIVHSLTADEVWFNRGELADLTVAALLPFWRQRDHFQRTLLGYWWKKSDPPPGDHNAESRLADAPSLQEAIGFLKQNVGHKKLVAANFHAFHRFAQCVCGAGIRLIVMEGQVHPAARRTYDVDGIQRQTREQMAEMAREIGFEYADANDMPEFHADDFADAYHLNAHGRQKLTEFLASLLNTTSVH